jgi:hypothetical protein
VRTPAGALVPLSEVIKPVANERERRLPQGPAAGGLRVGRPGRRDRQPALRHVRHARQACRHATPRAAARRVLHPPARRPYREYAIKWDGEWQVTYETFRDMGLAYAVGLMLIYLLVVAQFGSYSRR